MMALFFRETKSFIFNITSITKARKMLVKKVDMFLQIREVIMADGLSVAEEYKLLDMLSGRINGKSKCLASVIDQEMRVYEDEKYVFDDFRDFYLNITKKYFWETETGIMQVAMLSAKIINEFIIEVKEQLGFKGEEEYAFMQLLQIGLNKLEENGDLNFSPDRLIYRKFVASKNAMTFIKNPYSEAETQKIMQWADSHPADLRALAWNLYFTKGLTLHMIVSLTKKDCCSKRGKNICKEGIELFTSPTRLKIVKCALATHPSTVEYVFAVPKADYSGWEKLTEQGLLIKLSRICKETGIPYKPILINEAIQIDTD